LQLSRASVYTLVPPGLSREILDAHFLALTV